MAYLVFNFITIPLSSLVECGCTYIFYFISFLYACTSRKRRQKLMGSACLKSNQSVVVYSPCRIRQATNRSRDRC